VVMKPGRQKEKKVACTARSLKEALMQRAAHSHAPGPQTRAKEAPA
jgi:hypothetical protein